MNREELEQEIENVLLGKTENLKELSALKDRIQNIKAGVRTRKVYADANLFASLNKAMREAGRMDQEYGTKLSVLRKKLKTHYQQRPKQELESFEAMFVGMAKKRLSGEMFSEIRSAVYEAQGRTKNH